MLNFDPNLKIPLLSGEKIEGKILPLQICKKCDIYWLKHVPGVLNYLKLKKNTSKYFFLSMARNIVKIECEIYKYSSNICQIISHLKPVFRTSHSARPPKNSHPSCSLSELQLILLLILHLQLTIFN